MTTKLRRKKLLYAALTLAIVIGFFQNCGAPFEVLKKSELAQLTGGESTPLPGGAQISTAELQFERQNSDVQLTFIRALDNGIIGYSSVLRRIVRANLNGEIVETLNVAPDRTPEIIFQVSRFGNSSLVLLKYLSSSGRNRVAVWNMTNNQVNAVPFGDVACAIDAQVYGTL